MDDGMTPLRLQRAYGGTHKVHPIAAVCTTGIWPAVSARHGQRKARGASRPSFGDSNHLSRVPSSAIVGARAMLHELVRLGLLYLLSPHIWRVWVLSSASICTSHALPCRLRGSHCWRAGGGEGCVGSPSSP